jgi:heme oxygenase
MMHHSTPSSSRPLGLAASMRVAIADLHRLIEDLPVSRAMIDGSLDRETYLSVLRGLRRIHIRLDRAVAAHPGLSPLAWLCEGRSAAIDRDLAALGGVPDAADAGPAEPVPEFGAVIGWIYVTAGSRMGSRVLVRPLAAGLGVEPVPGRGLDYHLDGQDTFPARWQEARAAIDALGEDPAVAAAAVAGACAVLGRMHAIYAAAMPRELQPA